MGTFSKQVSKFNQLAQQKAERVFRGTALDLFGKIVQRTPVGNPSYWKSKKAPKGYAGGRLRGNWQTGVNSPETAKGSGAIGGARLGQTIFITNNLPYAVAIEQGHSRKQAPQGMVAVTVREFKAVVKRNAIKR